MKSILVADLGNHRWSLLFVGRGFSFPTELKNWLKLMSFDALSLVIPTMSVAQQELPGAIRELSESQFYEFSLFQMTRRSMKYFEPIGQHKSGHISNSAYRFVALTKAGLSFIFPADFQEQFMLGLVKYLLPLCSTQMV